MMEIRRYKKERTSSKLQKLLEGWWKMKRSRQCNLRNGKKSPINAR